MLQRVLTGTVFALLWLVAIAIQGPVLRLLILAAMLISMYEMYKALRAAGHDPIRWSGYMFCGLTFLFAVMKADLHLALFDTIDPTLAALALSAVIVTSAGVFKGKIAFDEIESAMFPMLYPGMLFALMMSLQDTGNRFSAVCILLLLFFTASVNDVFALFIGLKFGKHRLSPIISPKKSIEGSIAGLVSGTLFAVLVPALMNKVAEIRPSLNPDGIVLPALWKFAIFGFIAAGLSQIGDLTASMIKRHCGIKDFGTIFPGHGGMMDRMDGILYCAVACWFFFHMVGLY